MSGGAKTPTPANLSGNVSNANSTFGTATSDAGQTMNTAQQYNTNAQNNLSNVTNTSNSMAGQIGSQATQNMNTYGSTFVPLQQEQAQQAQAYGSQANISKLQGQAIANTAGADQAARANSAQALASEGVDPASIHGAALDRQASVTGAGQEAAAGTQSAINTTNTANQMVANANQLGTQVGNMGTAGAATAANTAAAGQQSVNQTNQTGVNNLTAANSYLKTGTDANSSAANIANTQFGEQQQAYTDQQQQSAGLMSSIGGIAGAAAMFMEGGGSVPGTPTAGIPTGHTFAHSGLPVRKGHVMPRQPIQMPFEPMDAGGQVTAKGALPVGSIPGTTDRKPAMLTPGEFVIPQDVVQHIGSEKLHKLVDKTREDANKRRAIPVNHPPHMSMN
jgi:hypothetical protein